MRVLLGLVLGGILAGCAHHMTPQLARPARVERATDDEKDAAGAVWRDCLLAQEPKYDDLISDAGTIARTLALDCEDQFNASMTVLSKGESLPFTRGLWDAAPKARYDMALRVVLVARAKRQGLAPPVPATR